MQTLQVSGKKVVLAIAALAVVVLSGGRLLGQRVTAALDEVETRGPWVHHQQWKLPVGGKLVFRMRPVPGAPGRSEKQLAWLRKEGTRQIFLLDDREPACGPVSLHLREDDFALWLVDEAAKPPRVVGSLDLDNGECHGSNGGVAPLNEPIERQRAKPASPAPFPSWAQASKGKVLAPYLRSF